MDVQSFIQHFEDWNYGWLDVPAMLRGADAVFEYPMIDRDPVPTWVDGNVALLGDAAHVMYPTGSNGASQAVIDARVLGAAMLEHGVTGAALQAYDARCAPRSWRSCCGTAGRTVWPAQPAGRALRGVFDDIDAVIPARAGGLHEPLQGRRRFCHGNAERRRRSALALGAQGLEMRGSAFLKSDARGHVAALGCWRSCQMGASSI